MDPVRQYQERFWTLWTDLKKILRLRTPVMVNVTKVGTVIAEVSNE